jgi:hypothetical protein
LRTKIHIFTLVLCIGVLLSLTAYASGESETLNVDEVWLTGDTLHIAVTDIVSGERCVALELNLRDYAKSGDEYVSVQATNSGGSVSNVIQFKKLMSWRLRPPSKSTLRAELITPFQPHGAP